MPFGRGALAAAIGGKVRKDIVEDIQRDLRFRRAVDPTRWSQSNEDAYIDLQEGFKIEARAGVPFGPEDSTMPFGFIKKAAKKIGGAIKSTAKFVGGTVGKVASVASGVVLGEHVIGSSTSGAPITVKIAEQPAGGTTERTSTSGLTSGSNRNLLIYGGIGLAAVLLLSKR